MKRLFVAFWLLGTVSLYALSIDTVAPPAPAKGTDLPAPATPAHEKSAAANSTGQHRSGTSLTTDTVPSHPFLFFSSEDIPHLRSITKTTHKHHYDRLKRVCDRFIDLHPISPASLPENWIVKRGYEPPALHSVGWSFLWYDAAVPPSTGPVPKGHLKISGEILSRPFRPFQCVIWVHFLSFIPTHHKRIINLFFGSLSNNKSTTL